MGFHLQILWLEPHKTKIVPCKVLLGGGGGLFEWSQCRIISGTKSKAKPPNKIPFFTLEKERLNYLGEAEKRFSSLTFLTWFVACTKSFTPLVFCVRHKQANYKKYQRCEQLASRACWNKKPGNVMIWNIQKWSIHMVPYNRTLMPQEINVCKLMWHKIMQI